MTDLLDGGLKHLAEDFGSEDGSDDIARGMGNDDDLFVETRNMRDFLAPETVYRFLVGTKGVGKTITLFKKAVLIRQLSGVLTAPDDDGQRAFAPSFSWANLVTLESFWQLTTDKGVRTSSPGEPCGSGLFSGQLCRGGGGGRTPATRPLPARSGWTSSSARAARMTPSS